MAEDWDVEIRLKPFEEGRRQANRLGSQTSPALKRSLESARRSRSEVGLWPSRRGERQYFDGFISRLEEELRRRVETGDVEAVPDIEVTLRPESPGAAVSLDDGYDPVLRLQADETAPPRTPTGLPTVPEFLFNPRAEDFAPKARRQASVNPPEPVLPGFLTEGWIEETVAARGPRAGAAPAPLPTLPDNCLKPMDAETAKGRSGGPAAASRLPDLPELLLKPMEERHSKPRGKAPAAPNGPAADTGPPIPIYELPDEPRGFLVVLGRTWAFLREAFRKPERVQRYQDWDD